MDRWNKSSKVEGWNNILLQRPEFVSGVRRSLHVNVQAARNSFSCGFVSISKAKLLFYSRLLTYVESELLFGSGPLISGWLHLNIFAESMHVTKSTAYNS